MIERTTCMFVKSRSACWHHFRVLWCEIRRWPLSSAHLPRWSCVLTWSFSLHPLLKQCQSPWTPCHHTIITVEKLKCPLSDPKRLLISMCLTVSSQASRRLHCILLPSWQNTAQFHALSADFIWISFHFHLNPHACLICFKGILCNKAKRLREKY